MTDKRRETGRADQQLDDILSRVKYVGPEPRPAEDELMDSVVAEIARVPATTGQLRNKTL